MAPLAMAPAAYWMLRHMAGDVLAHPLHSLVLSYGAACMLVDCLPSRADWRIALYSAVPALLIVALALLAHTR